MKNCIFLVSFRPKFFFLNQVYYKSCTLWWYKFIYSIDLIKSSLYVCGLKSKYQKMVEMSLFVLFSGQYFFSDLGVRQELYTIIIYISIIMVCDFYRSPESEKKYIGLKITSKMKIFVFFTIFGILSSVCEHKRIFYQVYINRYLHYDSIQLLSFTWSEKKVIRLEIMRKVQIVCDFDFWPRCLNWENFFYLNFQEVMYALTINLLDPPPPGKISAFLSRYALIDIILEWVFLIMAPVKKVHWRHNLPEPKIHHQYNLPESKILKFISGKIYST